MRRWFHMTPAYTPEPKDPDNVASLLRDHVAFTAAARAETRLARLEIRELKMKISELSSKVDQLIGLATSYKDAADGAATQQPPVPEDDPEVSALAARIDDAIAVLQGNKGSTPPTPKPPGQIDFGANTRDPNAPI